MTRHQYACPMRWGDMDAQAHVNNAAFLDYLQEARVDFLLSGPPVMHDLLEAGVLVVSHQLEYLAPVEFSARPLTIDLWVAGVGGSRFGLAYELRDGATLAVRARTAATPYDLAGNALRRLTAEERGLLLAACEDTEPLRPVARPAAGAPEHRYRLAVRWSDLDSYGHVNNVKYYDYLQEARIALVTEAFGSGGESGPSGTGDASGTEGAGSAGGAGGATRWLVVRQDLEYRRPMDFRTAPYEVATAVAAVGTRSLTLGARIIDPLTGTEYATGRTVVVAEQPLTEHQRSVLQGRLG